ncbi:hypothetical protein F5148DRAFT_947338, partial [Russula earlei]
GQTPKGATWVLQILISKAAHLVWVTRYEQVIYEHSHTEQELHTQWLRAINTRLTNDWITT